MPKDILNSSEIKVEATIKVFDNNEQSSVQFSLKDTKTKGRKKDTPSGIATKF